MLKTDGEEVDVPAVLIVVSFCEVDSLNLDLFQAEQVKP